MLLVTGITGHSGRYFLQRLIKEKYPEPVRFIVRPTSKIELIKNSGLNFDLAVGDLNDPVFLSNAMEGVTQILSIYRIIHSVDIVQQALAHNVERVILVHTCGMYSKHKSASEGYIEIEKKVKELVRGSDLQLTILRPTMIYGNPCDQNVIKFIKMVDHLKVFPIIDKGEAFLQPVHAQDLGNAYYDVLTNPNTIGKDYDLSGSEPITLREFLELIASLLGIDRYFISVPMNVGVFLAKALKLFTLGKFDYIEKVLRLGEDRSRSHEPATIDFGFSPLPLEEGLKREIDLYLKGKGKVKRP